MIPHESGEKKELFCSSEERDKFLEENPDWKQRLCAPKLVTSTKSPLARSDDGWKDTLKKIKSGSAKSNTINV
jgi:hypothetical protein